MRKIFAIVWVLAIVVLGGLSQAGSLHYQVLPPTGVETPAPLVPFGGDSGS